jgi:hypothetical protein
MTLKELKSCIDQAYKAAGKTAATANVEVWHNGQTYTITRIGQFGVVKDVSITIEKEGKKK